MKRIVKTVGSRSLEDAEASWAYLVEWQKGGKPDDEVSDVEFNEDGRLMRRRNDGTLVEVRRPFLDAHIQLIGHCCQLQLEGSSAAWGKCLAAMSHSKAKYTLTR